MAFLNREQILQADDLPKKIVSVPEWGGDVIVSTMSGKQRDELEASIVGSGGERNLRNLRARIVAASCVDESGQPVFTKKDVEALGDKSAAALDRIFEASRELSRFTSKDVEELSKNSSDAQGDASSSG
jgi:hypothetical protein